MHISCHFPVFGNRYTFCGGTVASLHTSARQLFGTKTATKCEPLPVCYIMTISLKSCLSSLLIWPILNPLILFHSPLVPKLKSARFSTSSSIQKRDATAEHFSVWCSHGLTMVQHTHLSAWQLPLVTSKKLISAK